MLNFTSIMASPLARSLWSGHIIQVKFHCAGPRSDCVLLCKEQSACMLMLGVWGHASPRKILKKDESGGILESIYLAIQCVLTCTINVKCRVICTSNYLHIASHMYTIIWHREYVIMTRYAKPITIPQTKLFSMN